MEKKLQNHTFVCHSYTMYAFRGNRTVERDASREDLLTKMFTRFWLYKWTGNERMKE